MQKDKILGSGIPALATLNIGQSCESAITATGTSSQANAFGLNADINEVTTTAANTGVRLRANLSPGDFQVIYNIGASTLSVYPPTGESINAIAANGAFSMATATTAIFFKVSATRWASLLTA